MDFRRAQLRPPFYFASGGKTVSGIFALDDKSGSRDLTAAEDRVTHFHLPGSAPHKIECLHCGSLLLGRYHLGIFPQRPIAHDAENGSVILASGYRVGNCPVPFENERNCSGFGEATLRFISQRLEADDIQALAELDGAFQMLYYHERRARLSVAVDRYGLHPLYWYEDSRTIAFAPDFSLLFALIGYTPEVDRESLAEFFELGFVAGDRTLFSGVRVFPPGSVACVTGRVLEFQRFWRPVFTDGNKRFDAEAAAEAFDGELRSSVRERLGLAGRAAISLSGGLDSRLLLAVAEREKVRVSAYTFGPEHSADHRIAALVARELRVMHHSFVDTPQPSVEIFETGVRKTGGMNNILDFTGMAHLPEIARQIDVVVNGYGGNELLGFLAFDLLRFAIPRRESRLAPWLAAKLNPGWSSAEIETIRGSLTASTPSATERLANLFASYPAKSPMARVYHFFFEEKARRANLLGVTSDNLFIEPMVPFYSNRVVDLALQIPPRERQLAKFYRTFLRRHYSGIAEIEYSRTGLPADASSLRIALRKLRRFGERDRDPDAPWDSWLRGELREYVQDHLLAGRPRIFDFIEPRLVRQVVTGTPRGQGRRVRPVGQLLTCELFLREFFGK